MALIEGASIMLMKTLAKHQQGAVVAALSWCAFAVAMLMPWWFACVRLCALVGVFQPLCRALLLVSHCCAALQLQAGRRIDDLSPPVPPPPSPFDHSTKKQRIQELADA